MSSDVTFRSTARKFGDSVKNSWLLCQEFNVQIGGQEQGKPLLQGYVQIASSFMYALLMKQQQLSAHRRHPNSCTVGSLSLGCRDHTRGSLIPLTLTPGMLLLSKPYRGVFFCGWFVFCGYFNSSGNVNQQQIYNSAL